MLKKILNLKFNSISAAAMVIAVAGLLSRLLGVVRDSVLAGQFGAGSELDIYYAAFRIPDLVFNLLILGALSAGFIPVFVGLMKKDDADVYADNAQAWNLVNNLLNILLVFLLVVCFILYLLSPWLVPLVTPGFVGAKLATTIKLTQLMFFSPILLGLSALFGGVLQSFKRVFVYSLAPIFYNVGIIFGALYLTPIWGIYGLGFGVILGAGLHLLAQVPTVFRLGYRYRFILDWREQQFWKIILLTGPRILGMAASQLNLVILTILASFLPSGGLAIFNLSGNLQSFPLGLIGISFSMAIFPILSRLYAEKKTKEFADTLVKTAKQIVFLALPFSILFIVLRLEIVQLVLGVGKFSVRDQLLTANALALFSASLISQVLVLLLVRAFYSRHNTWWPVGAGLFSSVINVTVSLLLIKKFGVLGLAIGFSAESICNFLLLTIILGRQSLVFRGQRLLRFFVEIVVAGVFMSLATWLAVYWLKRMIFMSGFGSIFIVSVLATLGGALIYWLVMYLFKSEQLNDFGTVFKRKLSIKVISPTEYQ